MCMHVVACACVLISHLWRHGMCICTDSNLWCHVHACGGMCTCTDKSPVTACAYVLIIICGDMCMRVVACAFTTWEVDIKAKWRAPEEQYPRLTSGLYTELCIYVHPPTREYVYEPTPTTQPTKISYETTWQIVNCLSQKVWKTSQSQYCVTIINQWAHTSWMTLNIYTKSVTLQHP